MREVHIDRCQADPAPSSADRGAADCRASGQSARPALGRRDRIRRRRPLLAVASHSRVVDAQRVATCEVGWPDGAVGGGKADDVVELGVHQVVALGGAGVEVEPDELEPLVGPQSVTLRAGDDPQGALGGLDFESVAEKDTTMARELRKDLMQVWRRGARRWRVI